MLSPSIVLLLIASVVPACSSVGEVYTIGQAQSPRKFNKVAASNNLIYISDLRESYVYRMDYSGALSIEAGTGEEASGGLMARAENQVVGSPFALLAVGNGDLYVTDYFNGYILRLYDSPDDVDWRRVNYWTDPTASLVGPAGITLGQDGTYYASMFNSDFNRMHIMESTGFDDAWDIIAGDGPPGESPSGTDALDAHVNKPTAVVTASDGTVYFIERDKHQVRKIATDGKIYDVVGNGTAGFNGDNIPAIDAQLNFPKDLVLTADGSLLISELIGCRIRRVDNKTGLISTLVGDGVCTSVNTTHARSASIDGIDGITLNEHNDLLFVEASKHRIKHMKAFCTLLPQTGYNISMCPNVSNVDDCNVTCSSPYIDEGAHMWCPGFYSNMELRGCRDPAICEADSFAHALTNCSGAPLSTGEACAWDCDSEHFSTSGDTVRTCQYGGSYTGATLACAACNPVTHQASGATTTCTTASNSITTACAAGYYLSSAFLCEVCLAVANADAVTCTNGSVSAVTSCATGFYATRHSCEVCAPVPYQAPTARTTCTTSADSRTTACVQGFRIPSGSSRGVCVDVTPPLLICPTDIEVVAGEDLTSNLTVIPSATDNVALAVGYPRQAPVTMLFSPGQHDITWIAVDTAGNTDQCNFKFIVLEPANNNAEAAAQESSAWGLPEVGLTTAAALGFCCFMCICVMAARHQVHLYKLNKYARRREQAVYSMSDYGVYPDEYSYDFDDVNAGFAFSKTILLDDGVDDISDGETLSPNDGGATMEIDSYSDEASG